MKLNKTLASIIAGGALALAGCSERELIEPQRADYKPGHNAMSLHGSVWFTDEGTNGEIRRLILQHDGTYQFLSPEEIKGRRGMLDGYSKIELTPEISELVKQQQKLCAELAYQMDMSQYKTLKKIREERKK